MSFLLLNSNIITSAYRICLENNLLDNNPQAKRKLVSELNEICEDKIERLIPITNVISIFDQLIDKYGPCKLGWFIGSRIKTHDLGILGYFLFSCKHMFYAHQILNKYQLLLSNLINFQFNVTHSEVVWNVTLPISEKAIESKSLQFLNNLEIAYRHHIVLELTRKKFKPTKICLTYPEEMKHKDFISEKFNCPVIFNQFESSIHYKITDINCIIPSANYHIYNQSEMMLNQFIQHWYQNTNNYPNIVTRLVLSNLAHPQFSVEMVANRLNISSRHLQRQLKKEGNSYNQILKDCRERMSIAYLRRGLSNKEISNRLGYKETNSFIRSFKEWNGLSPKKYRELYL